MVVEVSEEAETKVTMRTLYTELGNLRAEVNDSLQKLSDKLDNVGQQLVSQREFEHHAEDVERRITCLEADTKKVADHESRLKRVESLLWYVEVTAIGALLAAIFNLIF